MSMPSSRHTQTTAQDRFDALARALSEKGARTSSVFGKPSVKDAAGRAFACLHASALACRLGDRSEKHREALALKGAVLFDPSGRGRPMRDWVSIPVAHAERWQEFAEAALAVER
jgi:hypothetical protein